MVCSCGGLPANIIYNQIGLLKKENKDFKISNYLKRFTKEEQKEYRNYCRNIRQMRFRNANRLLCNERSKIIMRTKRKQFF